MAWPHLDERTREAKEALRLVRKGYTERKPVMGTAQDTYPYHALAIAGGKLAAIRTIISEWPDTILDMHALDDMAEAQAQAVEFVLDMAEGLIY